MAVLVTGAAGFIGSNIVDELMAQKFEVFAVDNLSEGKRENLERWKNDPRFTFVRQDIIDYDVCKRLCDHKEFVIHCAADSRIQTTLNNPLKAIATNTVGTANLLEASRISGVKRFVYSASSSVYGFGNQGKEHIPIREDSPPNCLNPYSLSKYQGEQLCKLYNDLYGLSTVSLRYHNVYGFRHQEEGSYATVIAIFRKQKRNGEKLTVVGDGSRRRDFTFVSDIVRANLMAVMNRQVSGAINLGTGVNYSILELAKIIANGDESQIEFIADRQGEAKTTLADITRAKTELGWKPALDLQQGLAILDVLEEKHRPTKGRIILL